MWLKAKPESSWQLAASKQQLVCIYAEQAMLTNDDNLITINKYK